MRDIKFRGKRVDNGDWVYGNLCVFGTYEIIPRVGIGPVQSKKVIPETVGQYTGLKDKNGKEIYEGDVCTFFNNYTGITYKRVVRYCPMFACFGLYPDMQDVWNYESDWVKIQHITIIGNIHDNPELLKDGTH